MWQSVNYRKCNHRMNKNNFLLDGITNSHFGMNFILMMIMTKLPFLNIFINFILILNAKPEITECCLVIFVKQLDKNLLDWCENKWIN